MSVCWQNTCRAQRVSPPVEQMPRRDLSKKGRPHCILEGGGWILGCQAKLSDLLIKEKHWLILLCAPVKRGREETQSEGSWSPIPWQEGMLDLDRSRAHGYTVVSTQ